MNIIQVTATFKIHSGKLEEFKKIGEMCLRSVKENDTDTLQYDWFWNTDRTTCTAHERYADSEAMLQHIENLGDTLDKLASVCDQSVEVFGDPSPDLKKVLDGIGASYHSFFLGTSG